MLRLLIKYKLILVFIGIFIIIISLLILDQYLPPNLTRLQDLSVIVFDRNHQPLHIFLNQAGFWRMATDPQQVATNFFNLLIAYEDRRFFNHVGVDPLAVLRAFVQNLFAGKVVSGASTLTMQVAKLLEPRPRIFSTKLIEMLRAVQLEAHFSKTEILAMYLSLAPYGGNIEGLQAATMLFLGKKPYELTPSEAALLVALPRAPSRLRPDRWPARAQRARDNVLERALALGVLNNNSVAEAKSEPVPERRLALPNNAYHFTARSKRQAPSQTAIYTTINGELQRELEHLAQRAILNLHERASLALLLVDNRNREVLAYVSGANVNDEVRNGYIDLVQTMRSPGSTLKPFIYGLGFNDGVIHPLTRLADVSTRFGDYAPRNFNRSFNGELTVSEALQRSLNIPAVMVLNKISPLRFTQALKRVGVRCILPKNTKTPGLPIALGGVALTLWDITSLYVALANDGLMAPLQTIVAANQAKTAPLPLLSAKAAQQVLNILENSPPPSGMVRAAETRHRLPMALKTGTSYGFRDAWAFGVSGNYTVGIWVGRPDGTSSPEHYGLNTAAPLVYQIFDLLKTNNLYTNKYATEPAPPALLKYLSVNEVLPPFNKANLVRLVFPNSEMTLEASAEPLILSAAGGRRPLTWLVDGQLIAISTLNREASWLPAGPGFARITVIDADGDSDTVTVAIK